jgi:hypothetical protein
VKRLITSLVLVGLLCMTVLSVAAADTTDVVTEDDVTRQVENTPPTDDWVLYTRAGTPPTAAAFDLGPGEPPLGVGSLRLTTVTGSEKVFLFNYDHVGTALADINEIGYATYRSAGSGQQVTALNIQVDYNGDADGGFTTLVFEPVYNTDQGAVINGEWQTWDADSGRWWSTASINGQCGGAAVACMRTWSQIIANNPDATILGGFGVNQGSGNAGLIASVDALTLGSEGNTVTYNFEPYEVAQTKDDCKNGGWEGLTRADSSSFKNQGDCIQYVNTGK